MTPKIKKALLTNLPYLFVALVATKLGLAWRLAEGVDVSEKALSLLGTLGAAFSSLAPSFHPFDLLIGILVAGALRLAAYAERNQTR